MKDKDLLYLEKLGYILENDNYVKGYGDNIVLSIDKEKGTVYSKKYFNRILDINSLKDMMVLTYIDRYFDGNNKFELDKEYKLDGEKHMLDIKHGDKAIIVVPSKNIDNYLDVINRFMFNEFPLFECLKQDKIKSISFLNTLYSKKEDTIIFNEHNILIDDFIKNFKLNDSTYKDPTYHLKDMIKQQERMLEKINYLETFKFKLGNSTRGFKKFKMEFTSDGVNIYKNDYDSKIEQITSKKKIQSIKDDIGDLFLQDWSNLYTSETPYSDYKEWVLTLEFKKENKMVFSGINSFPKNWDKLMMFLNEHTDDFVEEDE